MKAQVSKIFHFEAAHHLPKHDGKCHEPHGHSYRVVVHCEGNIKRHDTPKRGMVVDFADIKAVWKEHIEPLLDHKDLNVTLREGGKVFETTAECIAAFICSQFMVHKFPVKSVDVWETETSYASVTATEVWANGGN